MWCGSGIYFGGGLHLCAYSGLVTYFRIFMEKEKESSKVSSSSSKSTSPSSSSSSSKEKSSKGSEGDWICPDPE